ncbi:MAG: cystathionine beta-lyase [Alphaproteobacteria bacterium]
MTSPPHLPKDREGNRPETRLIHAGRNPREQQGMINPPVWHASTVLFPTMADLEASASRRMNKGQINYGRVGTPTSYAFEDAVAELEGGYRSVVASSGLAAVTTTLMAYAEKGVHFLIADSVYGPTRVYCDTVLQRLGIEITYYDPLIGSGIKTLIKPNTRLIYMESPGSLTFEVQDVSAIAAVARAAGIVSAIDNTWSAGLFFKPLDHGVDISLQAGTKYLVGHADAMMGVITSTEAEYKRLRTMAYLLGQCAGPDDIYLALRGMRTLAIRLHHHQESALTMARWLQKRPEVAQVLHPGLPEDPGHDLWKRDFTGSSGLFGVILKPASSRAVAAMLDGMSLFGMGFSWGGFESLIIPAHAENYRTAKPWKVEGPLIRLHIGLEAVEDLMADLESGFDRLKAAA